MYVRKVRRKCGVRGCKNIDCFSISRTREAGNTIIVCKNCLGEAFETIDKLPENAKNNISDYRKIATPALFFNDKVNVKHGDITERNEKITADVKAETGVVLTETESIINNESELRCPYCGKEFGSKRGLKTHVRYCNVQSDKE